MYAKVPGANVSIGGIKIRFTVSETCGPKVPFLINLKAALGINAANFSLRAL
jgi:hypothetical protein